MKKSSAANILHTLNYYINQKYFALIAIILLSAFMTFWKLGEAPVHEWDEARRGINALGMIEHHDYVNYYYGNELDTGTYKPPLMTWLVAASYKLFGYNEFALRFPSAIATVLIFIFAFLLITQYKTPAFAFYTCLILMSCKGIIGDHVGRTGDVDAVFVFFTTGFVYFFIRYIDFDKKNALPLAGVFLGIAFYTKGFAILLVLPGILTYLLLKRKVFHVLCDFRFWLALTITVFIALSWYLLNVTYGIQFQRNDSETNRWLSMIIYDVFDRFLSTDFESNLNYGPLFIFPALDIKFNLWNYILYILIIIYVVDLIRNKTKVLEMIRDRDNNMEVFAVCFLIPFVIIISLSQNKHTWYFAPVMIFIAIITYALIHRYISKSRNIGYIFTLLLLFALARHLIYLNRSNDKVLYNLITENAHNQKIDTLYAIGDFHQNEFLYLSWTYSKVMYISNINNLSDDMLYKHQILIKGHKDDIYKRIEKKTALKCASQYCLCNFVPY